MAFVSQTEEDPRPMFEDRGTCRCGSGSSTFPSCGTNLCVTCHRWGYGCVDAEGADCSCQLEKRCTNIFTRLTQDVTDGDIDFRPNLCFVCHLKENKSYDIDDLARQMMGGDRPVLRVFRDDHYLFGWSHRWSQAAQFPNANGERHELKKHLIKYGLMEHRGDPLEKIFRYSLCLRKWVNCAEVKHCWDCKKNGCRNLHEHEHHWHCNCSDRKRIWLQWDEQCKKCRGWSRRVGAQLGIVGASDHQASQDSEASKDQNAASRSNPTTPHKGVKHAQAFSPSGDLVDDRLLREAASLEYQGFAGIDDDDGDDEEAGEEAEKEKDEEEQVQPSSARRFQPDSSRQTHSMEQRWPTQLQRESSDVQQGRESEEVDDNTSGSSQVSEDGVETGNQSG